MRMRLLWRWGLILVLGSTFVVATGCGRWSWRDRHGEIEYEHDGHHHGHAPGHVHHPHGGPPGQMKKQNSGPGVSVEIN